MSVQHANIGVVKKDLQLYYNREFSKSFRGESSTNLITNTVASTGGWDGNLFNNWINATVALNVDMAPDGTMTAIKLTGGYSRWTDSITVAASTTYTASIWLKNINLGVDPGINIATGLNGTLVSYVVANTTITRSTIANWRRVSITYTIPASGVNQIQFGVRYEGDYPNQNSILVWGAQFEKKAYMTQYSNLATDYFSRNETITNLLTTTYSSLPTNWSVDGSGQATIGTYSYIENNSAIRVVDVNSNTRLNVDQLAGFSASTTYTFSVKYRKVSGTPTLRFQIAWYNSSNAFVGSVSFPTTPAIHIYDIDGWQLAWFTVTSPASTAKVLWFIQDGNDYTTYNHTYDLKEPQIQTGTYATKYASNTATANTLTSGGGLLDISGNNVNADLTNVSFDSTGYYFNGASSNRIIAKTYTATDPFWLNLGSISIWFKTSTNQNGVLVGWGDDGNTNFGSIEITADWTGGYADESLIAESYTASASQRAVIRKGSNYYANGVWTNITAVFDDNYLNLKIYINGVLETTSNNGSSSGAPFLNVSTSTSYFNIGRRTYGAGSEYFTGEIGQTMVYGRLLTAAEVLQNFNATRKTYGI